MLYPAHSEAKRSVESMPGRAASANGDASREDHKISTAAKISNRRFWFSSAEEVVMDLRKRDASIPLRQHRCRTWPEDHRQPEVSLPGRLAAKAERSSDRGRRGASHCLARGMFGSFMHSSTFETAHRQSHVFVSITFRGVTGTGIVAEKAIREK